MKQAPCMTLYLYTIEPIREKNDVPTQIDFYRNYSEVEA